MAISKKVKAKNEIENAKIEKTNKEISAAEDNWNSQSSPKVDLYI